jgi:RNA polymerase sigma factor (sigma-70 family)
MIASLAHGFARRSRHSLDELHPRKEAELKEAGLHEAKQVADFDDLYQVGCEAVLEVRDRYDPAKGSFQAFAYLRVRGAMIDKLAEKQTRREEQHQAQDESAGVLLNAALREDDRAFFDRLYALWRETSLDKWRDIIEGASFDIVRFFWGFLHQFADEVAPEIGEEKHRKMLEVATYRYWDLVLSRAAQSKVPLRDISGPLHMEHMERVRKASGLLPAKIDDRAMGRMLGKDGKTIARWRKDMEEVGAPPPIREDGSFTLRGQQDWDEWLDYWFRIAEPQPWSRLQKRREREAN